MFVYMKFLGYEVVFERMPFAKLYAGVDNGTLHVNAGSLHFLANRTKRRGEREEVLADD